MFEPIGRVEKLGFTLYSKVASLKGGEIPRLMVPASLIKQIAKGDRQSLTFLFPSNSVDKMASSLLAPQYDLVASDGDSILSLRVVMTASTAYFSQDFDMSRTDARADYMKANVIEWGYANPAECLRAIQSGKATSFIPCKAVNEPAQAESTDPFKLSDFNTDFSIAEKQVLPVGKLRSVPSDASVEKRINASKNDGQIAK